LYGLKQVSGAWFGKTADYLDFYNFKSSHADLNLFVKKTSTICTLLLLYVDDIIITRDNISKINCLQEVLPVRFEMKSLGKVSHFLSLEIENGYFISQKGYTASLLNRFGMRESKTMFTTMEPCLKLSKNEEKPLKTKAFSRHIVGSLFYLTIARPDIMYLVGVIAQFMDKPCEGHLVATKRIFSLCKRHSKLWIIVQAAYVIFFEWLCRCRLVWECE
jgi:hypothetical protein